MYRRRVPWADIHHVRRDKRLIYVEGQKDITWIIPITAFASLEEADRFIEIAGTVRKGELVEYRASNVESAWPPPPSH
jgi:hypothetical protein